MILPRRNHPILHLLPSANFKKYRFDLLRPPILRIFRKKSQKNLEGSRKAAIFAPAKRKEHGSNQVLKTFAQWSLSDWN